MLSIRLFLLGPTKKLSDVYAQCPGHVRNDLQRDISLPALDTANVRPVTSGSVGQLLLRPTTLLAQLTYPRSKFFLDCSHRRQVSSKNRLMNRDYEYYFIVHFQPNTIASM